ncbi:GNAT family N-acetyltransferase [Novipirellula caenicola]|uniref:N-acetyltransferase domain-containing protein n=1 Tax=Novipirellula caenicola TaxID=1536901 RepID=A0ABP9VM34_9BACT
MIPNSTKIPGTSLKLCGLTQRLNTKKVRERIVECCNETIIYDRLFRERLAGRPYTSDDARDFIQWAAAGWSSHRYYVFIANDPDGLPCASCDLKTATRIDDEIGYWRSQRVAGSMTMIVRQMLLVASNNGFNGFHARVARDNLGSIAVLERLDFVLSDRHDVNGRLVFTRRARESQST